MCFSRKPEKFIKTYTFFFFYKNKMLLSSNSFKCFKAGLSPHCSIVLGAEIELVELANNSRR